MARGEAVMSDEQHVRQAAPAPEGARCALHPTTAAEAICARCGNYMCGYCSDAGKAAECLTCRERAGASNFPFDRASFSVFALMDYAWQIFRHYWPKLTLLSAAVLISSQAIAILAALVSESGKLGVGVFAVLLRSSGTVVGIAGSLAQYAWCLRAVEGKPLDVEDLLRALRRLPQALLMVLIVVVPFVTPLIVAGAIVGLAMGAGGRMPDLHPTPAWWIAGGLMAMVVFVVALYLATAVAFSTVALVRDASLGAWDALRESWRITAGRRLRVASALALLGMIAFAGVFFCLVGVFPAMAYATLATTCMYNALRKEAPR
jgi:hypothetical protein